MSYLTGKTPVPDMKDAISISFIIPVLNGADFIGDCLDHIMTEMGSEDEIIVVDNGSTDKTMDIVRKNKNVELLQYPGVTIAALRNRGAEIAKGEYLAFIDADCLVCKGWREAVLNVLNDESIHATGSLSAVPARAPWVERAWLSQRYTKKTRVYYVGSANFVVKKNAFRDVTGFDESLVTDEDTDIGRRLTGKGYNIVEDPETRIIHLGNSKTLAQYYERQRWHSTSMIDTAFKGGLDKPFVVTVVYTLGLVSSLAYLFISNFSAVGLLLLLISLTLIPALTAFYKVILFKNAEYFFHLVILYFIFYMARILTMIQFIFKKLVSGLSKFTPVIWS